MRSPAQGQVRAWSPNLSIGPRTLSKTILGRDGQPQPPSQRDTEGGGIQPQIPLRGEGRQPRPCAVHRLQREMLQVEAATPWVALSSAIFGVDEHAKALLLRPQTLLR